ncbi:MAG TPA: FkbM family methyltransferase [Edaphobacter sp.]
MSFRTETIKTLKTTALGRIAVETARQAVDLAGQMTHPDLPNDQEISRITFRGKHLSILHRRDYSDRFAIKQCFEQDQYDMPHGTHGAFVERSYQQILAGGRKPLIVDCGSNIGSSVLWFTVRYPEAHVLAVEPAPDNFAFLTKNCAGLDVDLRQAGISGTNGISHLVDCGMGGSTYQTSAEGNGPEIAMLAIGPLLTEKLASNYVPFILKIDVEGAESTLFDGDCSALNQFPLIIMEPHDWLLPGQHSSVGFFRFHAAFKREFCMNHENIGSIAYDASLLDQVSPPEMATVPVQRQRPSTLHHLR